MAADGARLNLHRGGRGEPLALLHGLGLSLRTWLPVVPALARRHDVIALDMPGFGDSPPLPAGTPSTVPALADAVEGVPDGLASTLLTWQATRSGAGSRWSSGGGVGHDPWSDFRRRIQRAEHRPLRGLGHVPMWDDPEVVASTILDFTARAEARESARTAVPGS